VFYEMFQYRNFNKLDVSGVTEKMTWNVEKQLSREEPGKMDVTFVIFQQNNPNNPHFNWICVTRKR